MGVVLLFGGATGVFVAAYLWLLFATGLATSSDLLLSLDVVLLAIGVAMTLAVVRHERGRLSFGQGMAIALTVTALATLISRVMLWVALRVDDDLLFRLAAERGATVQDMGLTPASFTVGSGVTFLLVGCAISLVATVLLRRNVEPAEV
jgi:hypothetical protein